MKRIYTQPLDAQVDALETKASDLEKAVQKCPYRIGDVLMTFNETHPGTSWPGTTWERLDDRFLIGAGNTYALDATGGSTTKNLQHYHTTQNHTLTINEMPSHGHPVYVWDNAGTTGNAYYYNGATQTTHTGARLYNASASTWINSGSTAAAAGSGRGDPSGGTALIGGGAAHNHGNTGNGGSTTQDIMPPYRAVYMYRRLT